MTLELVESCAPHVLRVGLLETASMAVITAGRWWELWEHQLWEHQVHSDHGLGRTGFWPLVPPGVVAISEWRHEPNPIPPSQAEVSVNGGVAPKS